MTSVTTIAQTNGSSTYDKVADFLPILAESATINEVRQTLIAETAYFLSAKRGFATGHELEDWLAAEIAIDRGSLKGASHSD